MRFGEEASGIYQILNTSNGKRYIGSARSFNSRWVKHRADLRNGCHHSVSLQRAWNKYGEQSFVFSVLEFCSHEELISREQVALDSISPEYNICKVAGSSAGRKTSEATKKLLSLAISGKKRSEETKKRMKEARAKWTPGPVSDATREKLSLIHKGRSKPRTVEHSAKIGLSKRKFSNAELRQMKNMLSSGARNKNVSIQFGCSEAFVSLLASGKRYAEV